MLPRWSRNIMDKLDTDMLQHTSVNRYYTRDIVNVTWDVVGVNETSMLGDNVLILTCSNKNDHDAIVLHDIVIPKPSYPGRQIRANDMLHARVTGINPMCEIDDQGQPRLVCKYARLIIHGTRRFNPHVSIDSHKPAKLTNLDQPAIVDANIDLNAQRQSFTPDEHIVEDDDAQDASRSRAHNKPLKPGTTRQVSADVIINWVA